MKRVLLSATALSFALTASAFAADLPNRKAPAYIPPPPPPPLWTGFYVGLNAGGVFGESDGITLSGGGLGPVGAPSVLQSNVFVAYGASTNASITGASNGGFLGGGQIGYNWQFGSGGFGGLGGGGWVVGVEADIAGFAGSNGAVTTAGALPIAGNANSVFGTATASKSLDYIGTVRGRIGFLFTPTLLIYGTGGLAYGGANLNTSGLVIDGSGTFAAVFGSQSYSDTRVGWTAGGGVEWMFMPNWSAKLEYLYYDLGTVTTNGGGAPVTNPAGNVVWGALVQQACARYNGNIIRAGVNYHFNFAPPAPVLAKY